VTEVSNETGGNSFVCIASKSFKIHHPNFPVTCIVIHLWRPTTNLLWIFPPNSNASHWFYLPQPIMDSTHLLQHPIVGSTHPSNILLWARHTPDHGSTHPLQHPIMGSTRLLQHPIMGSTHPLNTRLWARHTPDHGLDSPPSTPACGSPHWHYDLLPFRLISFSMLYNILKLHFTNQSLWRVCMKLGINIC